MHGLSRSALIATSAGLAASLGFVSVASAQFWPLQTVVTRFTPGGAPVAVPGLPASQVQAATDAGTVITWNNPGFNTPGLNTPPAIDSSGNIAFHGAINTLSVNAGFPPVATPVITTANQRVVFYGSTYSSLVAVARDGDANAAAPAQGGPTPSNVPTGWRLNSNTGAGGLNTTGVGLTSNGKIFFGSLMASAAGAPITATSTNNAGFFVGTSSGTALVARRGDLAPDVAGVTGAAFATNLNVNGTNGFPGGVPINSSGQVAFASAITGGVGVSTSGATQNDSGIFLSGTSGISNVVRRGDVAPGTGGATFGSFTANIASGRGLNGLGGIAFTNNLSTNVGQGVPPAAAQAGALFYAHPGLAPQLVAQSGTLVGSALPGESYVNGTATTTPHVSTNSSTTNNNGYVLYGAKFAPSAGITANVNDTAIMAWKYSTTGNATGDTNVIVARTGVTPVPANPGAVFSALDFDTGGNGNSRINNNNNIFFRATIKADGALATPIVAGVNDLGIFQYSATGASAPQMLMQTGMAAPGAGGATFKSNIAILAWNNLDYVVFQSDLSDNRRGLFASIPGVGLLNIVLTGDTSIMGAAYPLGGFGVTGSSNGEGGSQALTDNGWFAFNATATGNSAMVRVQIPAPGTGAIAGLMMLGACRRRRRA